MKASPTLVMVRAVKCLSFLSSSLHKDTSGRLRNLGRTFMLYNIISHSIYVN